MKKTTSDQRIDLPISSILILFCFLFSIMPIHAQNFGVGVPNPQEKLDLNGAIRIGNATNANSGTLRYTSANGFEGRHGGNWISLSAGSLLSSTIEYGTSSGQNIFKRKDASVFSGDVTKIWGQNAKPGTNGSGGNLEVAAGWASGLGWNGELLLKGRKIHFYSGPASTMQQKMILNEDGNFGIGTTSPNGLLHVTGDVILETNYVSFGTVSSLSYLTRPNAQSGNGSNTIFRGQNAATGGSGTGGNLSIEAGYGAGSSSNGNVTLGGRTVKFLTGTGLSLFQQAIIDANGNVGIAVTVPTHLLHVNGIARSSQSTWATTSDRRVKKNIQNIESALATIEKFRPVTFEWKEEYATANEGLKDFNYGFVSQEVEQIIPEMVTTVQETYGKTTIEDFKVLNTDALVPLLVKAVQEQQQLIAELKIKTSRLAHLESEIALLKTQNSKELVSK